MTICFLKKISEAPPKDPMWSHLQRDMLGAPSNLLNGPFCPSFKNLKSFFFLFRKHSNFFSSLFRESILISSLLSSATSLGGLLLHEPAACFSLGPNNVLIFFFFRFIALHLTYLSFNYSFKLYNF